VSSPGAPSISLEFRHDPVPELVTCIVPVFNSERFLGEALDSILAQGYPHREILVVDDGSTDDTPSVLDAFRSQVQVLRQENAGPSVARNRGMEEGRGAYFAFLDSDDLWVRDKLRLQLECLAEDPDLGFCAGHVESFWIPELEDEARRLRDHPYHRERPHFIPSTIMVRRGVVERIGGFDPELRHGEDTDWVMRMMADGVRHEMVPKLLVRRRQHGTNLTRQQPPTHEHLAALLKRNLDRGRAP
jgi:glycosyltransferase involved in cell wall biosynthesis